MKPVRKRKLVDGVRSDWGVSIRRACWVFLIDTSTCHRKSRRAEQADLELPSRRFARPAYAMATAAFGSFCGAKDG
jgi:putative transposase